MPASHFPIDVKSDKIDMLSLSGHKIHAPKGIGALYIKKGTLITPRQFGGEQQSKIRPGTEASALIAGFGQAVSEIDLDKISVISELNAYLRERLSEIEGIVINSPDNALEYVINFSVRGKKSGMISDEDAVKAAFPEPEIETVPVEVKGADNE